MNEYLGSIEDDEIEVLRSLLGREIKSVYAPTLEVDLIGNLARAFGCSFWIDGKNLDFVNIGTNWVQTEIEDYHIFRAKRSNEPENIPFVVQNGMNMVGPTSTFICDLGKIVKIEVLEAFIEVHSTIDGKKSKDAFRYDRILNFFGQCANMSLTTELGPIMGDIQLRNFAVSCAHNETEKIRVRRTLS